ncbi:MAG: hypothetical protein J6B98_04765 [Bacilli bacterium]|nr:hypothetical protein [Bacilli bacterium]
MVSLKELSDYENEMKDQVRELHKSLKNVENHVIEHRKNYAKSFWFWVLLTIPNIIFFSPISVIVIILAIININSNFNSLEKVEDEKQEYISTYKNSLDILDESIDSCELLKQFIRGKNLEKEELVKISTFLYATFGSNIDEVKNEIEKKYQKVLVYDYTTNEDITHFIESSNDLNTPKIEEIVTRKLKR